jgi:peptidoglycan/LPS O-acetylase OafA/YrhL
MSRREKKRDPVIDILRTIGLLLVILAHSGISDPVFSIREFDVTMLVFVSGISFLLGEQNEKESGWQYIWKRFKRLVLPVWGFLCFYYLFAKLTGHGYEAADIMKSFALLPAGASEVWVFRIFFIAALINPLCRKVSCRRSPVEIACAGAALLLLNDVLYQLLILKYSTGVMQDILRTYIPYTIGYGVVSMEAMSWQKADRSSRWIMAAVFFFLFAVSGVLQGFGSLQTAKYPPTSYYLAYGIACTMLLYQLISGNPRHPAWLLTITNWLSRHSMAVYLWHIFALGFLSYCVPGAKNWPWLPIYFSILGIAVVFAWLQSLLLQQLTAEKRSVQ